MMKMEYRQAEVEWGGFLDLAPAGLPHMRFIKRISGAGHMGYLLNKAEDSVTDGKHWEAVREGIEDYEYLRMLRDRVNELKEAGFSGKALEEAELLLQDAPVRVAGKFEDSLLHWSAQKDRSVADIERVRILEALERLREVVRP